MIVYRVNKAVGAGLLILVDLIDNQEHHTHQEGQGTDHEQSHLKKTQNGILSVQILTENTVLLFSWSYTVKWVSALVLQ